MIVVVLLRNILCGLCEWLKITPNNCVNKHTSVLFSISRRNIHHVGLNNHRAGTITLAGGMECSNGTVVSKPVISTNNAKTDDMTILVEDLEAFGAAGRRETWYKVDLPECAHITFAVDETAAFDEVFVGLWLVEAANDGPDGGDGGGCFLDDRRA